MYVDDSFAYWLTGFIDGEGCFSITRNQYAPTCNFDIHVRGDDAEIIYAIHEALGGIGVVRRVAAKGSSKPQVALSIRNTDDCIKLIDFLDKYPLRAKKLRDYVIWREAVLLKKQLNPTGKQRRGRSIDWTPMENLYERLRESHRYRDILDV